MELNCGLEEEIQWTFLWILGLQVAKLTTQPDYLYLFKMFSKMKFIFFSKMVEKLLHSTPEKLTELFHDITQLSFCTVADHWWLSVKIINNSMICISILPVLKVKFFLTNIFFSMLLEESMKIASLYLLELKMIRSKGGKYWLNLESRYVFQKPNFVLFSKT